MKRFIGILCACFLLVGGQVAVQAQQPDLKEFYALIDSFDVDLYAPHTPLIGISSGFSNGRPYAPNDYIRSVIKAGGAPILIPAMTDGTALRSIVAHLDGLVMIGGEDIDPLWYNEEPNQHLQDVNPFRDTYDLKLLKLASDRNIPILGVCRGEQLINVAFGGTLYQDIPSQCKEAVKHKQTAPYQSPSHTISIKKESQLARILGKDTIYVNSLHHQSVKDLAPGFRRVASAKDGVVEAIEAWPDRPIIGVQWHPEGMTAGGDTTMLKLFRFLVGKADTFHLAKEMHKRFLSVDTHTDTPLWFKRPGFNIGNRESNRVNIPKMQEGHLDGVFLAAWVKQGKRDEASLRQAVGKVTGLIEGIHKQVEANKELCGVAVTAEDFIRLKEEGKRAFFIGIENGYGIGKELSNIARFKSMGVNYITLCHSYDNDICDSSSNTEREWGGLSPFGEEVVKEMNRQGVMIDLSHTSEETFFDVLKLTKLPILCSHSSSRALCNHNRNLTDEQLRALAQNGGVVQVCLYGPFLSKDQKRVSLTDALDHIDHIVKVAGIDHVGIGSDFDGGGGIAGCEGSNNFIRITVRLIERGYSEEDIAKIWGGNLMRVLTAVQAAAPTNKL